MPIYIFENKKGETKEVYQKMTDPHIHEENGEVWNRVFTKPQAAVSTIEAIDPFNKKQFLDKTRDMKGGTVGNLWDISAQLSEKRAKKAGKDPIKEKAIKDYEKKCGGMKHPHAK